MKTINKHFRSISLVFAIIMLMQSCVIYRQKPFTLAEAAKTESKVKVHTITDKTLKFKRIGYKDGQYYGIKKINDAWVKTPLDRAQLNKIKVQNKNLSLLATIALPTVILTSLVVAIGNSMSGGFN